jgi:hypothetical protein
MKTMISLSTTMALATSLHITANGTETGEMNHTPNAAVQNTLLRSGLNPIRHFKADLLPGKAIVGI